MARLRKLSRENPQVALLILIGLVLGIGCFVAVLIALAASGSMTTNGEPTGAILRFALGGWPA